MPNPNFVISLTISCWVKSFALSINLLVQEFVLGSNFWVIFSIPPFSITVSTDRFHYEEGDIIVISGKVPVIVGNTPVTLQLFSGSDLIAIEQTTVAQDGSFTKAFFPDILWEQGNITVEASYQEYKAETKFSYTTKPTYSNYQNCDPSYPDVCIPPYPPDLDCGEIGYSNFIVIQPDPHRFDTDYDGIGCES